MRQSDRVPATKALTTHSNRGHLLIVFAGLLVQCVSSSSGAEGSGGGPPTPQSCTADGDCPTGQGCYDTNGSADRYCTKLCSDNNECSGQYLCPTFAPFAESDCRQHGEHGGKGVCQIYDSSLGPNECASAPGK